ncbi:MAG TPA: hypothetical protein VNK04_14060 [Gemmataceae bacterium]|nr:hypothetical protein [Gemmataceae bacterium]
MSKIPLTGLVGSQPIGALAAFGLLRVCSSRAALGQVKLGWNWAAEPTAVLVTETDCDADCLVELLVDHMNGRHQFPPFCGQAPMPTPNGSPAEVWDDLKPSPKDFTDLLTQTRDASSASNREAVDFLAAFGCELITASSTGDLKPTAFDMTAGQQKFLKSVRELAASLTLASQVKRRKKQHGSSADPVRSAFREALFGPWTYGDDFHSLGWDPSTEALHALSAIAPTDAGPKSVRAAVWLAVEALPLFPCFPVAGRLHTRGFSRTADEFRWPIWQEPISLDALRSLFGLRDLYQTPPRSKSLCSRGIVCLYASVRETDANGRGIFRPAVLVPLAGKQSSEEGAGSEELLLQGPQLR